MEPGGRLPLLLGLLCFFSKGYQTRDHRNRNIDTIIIATKVSIYVYEFALLLYVAVKGVPLYGKQSVRWLGIYIEAKS